MVPFTQGYLRAHTAWEGWRVRRRARAPGAMQAAAGHGRAGAHLPPHVAGCLGREHGALALPTRAGHGRLGRLRIGGRVAAKAVGLPVGVAAATTAIGRCGVVGGTCGRRLVAPLEEVAAAVAHRAFEELAAHVPLCPGGVHGARTQAARAGHRRLGRAVAGQVDRGRVVGQVDRGRRGPFESAKLVLLAPVDLVRERPTVLLLWRCGPLRLGCRCGPLHLGRTMLLSLLLSQCLQRQQGLVTTSGCATRPNVRCSWT